MLIPILFHEVIINKCICHGFYFVHCIQFSQLSDLDIVRSCAQEVRAVDGMFGIRVRIRVVKLGLGKLNPNP